MWNFIGENCNPERGYNISIPQMRLYFFSSFGSLSSKGCIPGSGSPSTFSPLPVVSGPSHAGGRVPLNTGRRDRVMTSAAAVFWKIVFFFIRILLCFGIRFAEKLLVKSIRSNEDFCKGQSCQKSRAGFLTTLSLAVTTKL